MTRQERLFVRQYLIDRNATQAAIRAGYSEKSAGELGHRLLKKVEIARAVSMGLAKIAERADIDAEKVLNHWAHIAFANPRDVLSWSGRTVTLKPSEEIPDHVMVAIAEISETPHGLKVKFHPKGPALEALSRHLGLFEKDNRQIGKAMAEAVVLDSLFENATNEQLEVLDDLLAAKGVGSEPRTSPTTH